MPISERPPEADGRSAFGHWEADSVIGVGCNLHTEVERRTRFLMARIVPDKTAGEASGPNLRKIEPPARFVLDELSNIETWGGLRNAITQGGGNGYQLLVVEQSRDMMVRDYDRETEQTVWNNCNRIMLGGVTDRDSLEWWGMQIGRHEVTRFESTWNPGQGPLGGVTERRGAEETVLPWELSRLPRGWMVVQPVREAPALVRAPHFMERGWWHDAEGDR